MIDHYAHNEFLRSVGRTFFVDATGGNDGNSGRSPDDAWRTIGKVNGKTFLPGDHILFKRGETWTGVGLVIQSPGAASAPIVFGAYGSGALPIIDGNDAVAACIQCWNQNWINFEYLECKQAIDYAFDIASAYVNIRNCVASDCGDDNIAFSTGSHHCLCQDTVSYNPFRGPGHATRTISCIEIEDGAYDITLDNVKCYGSVEDGITVFSHAAGTMPRNIVIKNSYSYGNANDALRIWSQGTLPANPAILVQNCQLSSSVAGSRALHILGATGVTPPSNVTVEDSILSGSGTTSYRANIQGSGHKIRRNAIICVPHGCYLNNVPNLEFYNNTIYCTVVGTIFAFVGTNNAGAKAKNNIIYTSVDNKLIEIIDGAHVGLDIDYNLYYNPLGPGANRWVWRGTWYNWTNWKLNSGQDSHSPVPANPLFNAPPGDLTLQEGSPAINAGVNVGLPYCRTAPDCGAYEKCP